MNLSRCPPCLLLRLWEKIPKCLCRPCTVQIVHRSEHLMGAPYLPQQIKNLKFRALRIRVRMSPLKSLESVWGWGTCHRLDLLFDVQSAFDLLSDLTGRCVGSVGCVCLWRFARSEVTKFYAYSLRGQRWQSRQWSNCDHVIKIESWLANDSQLIRSSVLRSSQWHVMDDMFSRPSLWLARSRWLLKFKQKERLPRTDSAHNAGSSFSRL